MMPSPALAPLVLGPMLRYVGETHATVWVETAQASTVTVAADGRTWSAATFVVKGHHFALVIVDGLEAGDTHVYEVAIDDTRVWPPSDSPFPAPAIRTLDRSRPLRLAFGSCRVAEPHDAAGNKTNGVDALRTLAIALADGQEEWPDLMAFLGDQVYADLTPDAMREFIAGRRDIDEPPGVEIKDYEEYAHLYQLAWNDPANRWLLSTLPSCMIFDDHDIRDDWNTSWSWHEEINRTQWWHERLMGGLASYWVYQHIGNLSPEELTADAVFNAVLRHEGDDELDLTDAVFGLVERVDRHPEVYRWSYRRDLGDSRLVVIDSRAARVLEPARRSMLDPDELAWLDHQLTGEVDHLLIGTSLPFLLPPGLHDLEAIDEAAAEGAYGGIVAKVAEKSRQVLDLEHWAAFDDGFESVFDIVMDVARGNRGRPPIRNPMPIVLRVMVSGLAKGLVRPMNAWARRSKRVPDPAYPWSVTGGPWFDNCFAELSVDGADLAIVWRGGEVPKNGPGADQAHPRLTTVGTARIVGGRGRS